MPDDRPSPESRAVYLQEMAYLYTLIGRTRRVDAKGKPLPREYWETPWVENVPEGNWSILRADKRLLAHLCRLLGCTLDELLGKRPVGR